MTLTASLNKGHTLVKGPYGVGKTTFLMNQMEQWMNDFLSGQRGFTVLDWYQEHTSFVLGHLLKRLSLNDPRWNKVHVITWGNESEYPVAFNILRVMDPYEILSLLSESVSIPESAYPLIARTIQKLIQEKCEQRTILDIPMALRIRGLWTSVLTQADDPIVRTMYQQNEAEQAELQHSILAVESAIGRLFEGSLRLHVGQPDSHLPLTLWMEQGHIVLFDFSYLNRIENSFLIPCIYTLIAYAVQLRQRRSHFHTVVLEHAQLLSERVLNKLLDIRDESFSVVLSSQEKSFFAKGANELFQNEIQFYRPEYGVRDAYAFQSGMEALQVIQEPFHGEWKDNVTGRIERIQSNLVNIEPEWKYIYKILQAKEGSPRHQVNISLIQYLDTGTWKAVN